MNWIWPADWNWALDGWIVLAGILCAVSASLLGNFLVLRRMSMLGDAISHAVLPGLAVAFLVTGSRSSWPMFLGAVLVGILTALATQWIRDSGNVDEGASMGVVFTCLFAIGLVLIVRAADHVDLDPGCVLYGALETSMLDTQSWGGWRIPRVVVTLSIVLLVNLAFVGLFFKELTISSFDPALSTTLGIPASWMHYLLMTLVAVTAVACFETVGNILVVAMFVVPPAAALLITERLSRMVWISAGLAATSAIWGHWMATVVPGWFGYGSTTTAGMMAVAAGLIFGLAFLFGPRQGVVLRWWQQRQLAARVLAEDVIGLLYRQAERQPDSGLSGAQFAAGLYARPRQIRQVLFRLVRQGLAAETAGRFQLTTSGMVAAQQLIRSHRLWEQYLASQADVPLEKIHAHAERLEHFTSAALRQKLDEQTSRAERDPHGSPIPPEGN